MQMRARLLALMAALLSACLTTTAFADADFWPGTTYDPAIPSIEATLGYTSGERITTHADAKRYFEALAKAAPDRMRLFPVAKSWEGREVFYAVISSPENIARLDAFKAGMQALADPRKTDKTTADTLIGTLPASLWMAYGIHGNEISSTDASMMAAYHLLATKAGDDRVAAILANTLVFINPMQNPDGRDRFITRFRSTMGLEADSDRISAEHNEPWPQGRTNHYLFDMNRDWLAFTQPETRGHMRELQEWYPLAYIDFHEMGGDASYYFTPEADPYNPYITKTQRDSLFLFGRNNAKSFDRFGRAYYTRDIFDAFYPGYGASWPLYFGSLAMTYEQASARGLVFRKSSGKDMTYRDTVMGHFLTSMASAETVALNREKLLRDFYDYQVSALTEGKSGNRTYVFPANDDKAANRRLALLLAAQGIDVTQATAAFKACGKSYGAGAYVVDAAQPRARMIRTLLEKQVDMDAAFLKEQERRRKKNLDHDMYDVTGWALPLQLNVAMDTCQKEVAVTGSAVSPDLLGSTTEYGDAGPIAVPAGTIGFLAPWGDAAAGRLMTSALRAGVNFKSSDTAFTLAGRAYPSGTLIFMTADNGGSLDGLPAIAARTGAEIVPIASSWVDKGRDLGSRDVYPVYPVKIAMAWDDPTSQLSAGNTRFVLERQFGYPVTVIRTETLAQADLSRYQVLILPSDGASDGYAATLGEAGAKNLAAWVRRGGVIVAQDTAVRFLADEKTGLIALKREAQVREVQKPGEAVNGLLPGSEIASLDAMQAMIEPAGEAPDLVPGALVYAETDTDHWLMAGVKKTLVAQYDGTDIYAPLPLDEGDTVAWFKGADEVLASGYLWAENRKQLAYKPFVVSKRVGRGYVIAFTTEPTMRAYLDGLNVLYLNAVFRAASHASPVR